MNLRVPLFACVFLTCIISSSLPLTETWSMSFLLDPPSAKASYEQIDGLLSESSSSILGFIRNEGQLKDDNIYFYSLGGDTSVGFGLSSMTYARETDAGEMTWLTVAFLASKRVIPVGQSKCEHTINYFLGDTHATDISAWNEVWYHDLYEGIDLRFFISSKGLKYDFIVHPGANLDQIMVQASDSREILINPDFVQMHFDSEHPITPIIDAELCVYQDNGQTIEASFTEVIGKPDCYGFDIGDFDETQTLIIDPLILNFSTFIGGFASDEGTGIAVDSEGYVYVTGWTGASTFPTQNGYDMSYNGESDGFILKMTPSGQSLVFATFIGGNETERTTSLGLDSETNVYVVGYTNSLDFPVVGAYQSEKQGPWDPFVVRLSSSGSSLDYSTYFGGSASYEEQPDDVAVDAEGNAYVVGHTNSADFPLINAIDGTISGEGFLFKLNATGSPEYSTGLSSIGGTSATSVAVDSDGYVVVGGYGSGDVFITRINPTGTSVNFTRNFGGSGTEQLPVLTVDDSGAIYLATMTDSANALTHSAYDSSYNGGWDVYVIKLSANGSIVHYATYLGGTSHDLPYGIAVDAYGRTHIGGYTLSDDFPMRCPFRPTLSGYRDVFVAVLNFTGNGLNMSTYLGGSIQTATGSDEYLHDLAVSPHGDILVTGSVASPDFPLENAYDSSHNGHDDCFVTKLTFEDTGPLPPTVDHPPDISYVHGTSDHFIEWHPYDYEPQNYSILRNGSEIKAGLWNHSSEVISVCIDGLIPGVHNFTLVVYNIYEKWASDYVIVSVSPGPYLMHQPIHIASNEDLQTQAFEEGWPGNGSIWEPYIIERLEIVTDATCISISDVTMDIIIRDCYLSSPIGSISGRGVYLQSVEKAIVEDCWIYAKSTAVEASDAFNSTFYNNSLSFGRNGLLLESCTNMIIRGNFLNHNSEIGVSLDSDCTECIVYGNYLGFNGASNANDDGSNNDWSYDAIGNSWSDYQPGPTYAVPGTAGNLDYYPSTFELEAPELTNHTSSSRSVEDLDTSLVWSIKSQVPVLVYVYIDDIIVHYERGNVTTVDAEIDTTSPAVINFTVVVHNWHGLQSINTITITVGNDTTASSETTTTTEEPPPFIDTVVIVAVLASGMTVLIAVFIWRKRP